MLAMLFELLPDFIELLCSVEGFSYLFWGFVGLLVFAVGFMGLYHFIQVAHAIRLSSGLLLQMGRTV